MTLTGTPARKTGATNACGEHRETGSAATSGARHDPVEELADGLGVEEPAGGVEEHPVVGAVGEPVAIQLAPPAARTCIVLSSRSMQRRLVRVLTSNSTGLPARLCNVREIDSRLADVSRSDHLSPTTSPRRIPVNAARCKAGYRRWERAASKKKIAVGQFLGGPRTRPDTGRPPAGVGGVGDVAVEELSAHGEVEGGPHDHVDLVHCLGCEPGPVAARGGGELLVARIEVIGPESSQWHVADGRVDVAVDEPRVAVGGRRPDVAALERQPGIGQELAEMRRPASGRCGAGPVAVDASGYRLGLVAFRGRRDANAVVPCR